MSYLKPQVIFSSNFPSLFSAMGDKSFVLFLLKAYLIFSLIIFSAKVQNFRLSTAQVKFHQICTLISYLFRKYIKFQLKNNGEVIMKPKSDKRFEEKLIFCLKNDKNLVNFDPSTKKSQKFAL